jgi:phage terminase large subunit-like protein
VIEANQGGEMNRMILHNAADVLNLERPNIILVRAQAGESKELRAQPVAQAYRAGKILHGPLLRDSGLEAQMASWVPGDRMSVRSPDRVDALVWLVIHLLFRKGQTGAVRSDAKGKLQSWRGMAALPSGMRPT